MTEISEADRLVMRAVLSDAIAWLDDLTLPVEEQLSAHEISMGLGTCERLLPDPAPSRSTLSEASDDPVAPHCPRCGRQIDPVSGCSPCEDDYTYTGDDVLRPPLVPWPGWLQP